jgi:hypothetical protein
MFDAVWRIGYGVRRRDRENRAQPLSTCEQAVAHGAMDGDRLEVLAGYALVEHTINRLNLLG